MRISLSTVVALLLATAFAGAQDPRPASTASTATVSSSPQTMAKLVVKADENLILKGAELKTEWANARNPFRFEVNDSPAYTPERVEQMQVLGFSKMPDGNGLLQTYAFVTKTIEGPRAQDGKPEAKVTKDVYALRALPEKLDEDTVTTEEQIEESSIALGSEQLWFVGAVQTNAQTLAIFISDSAPYPIKEEDLRLFEMQDSLKDMHVRMTKAGQKISTEANTPRTLLRSRSKSTPLKLDTTIPIPPDKPVAPPVLSPSDQKPIVPSTPAKAANAAPPVTGPNASGKSIRGKS